MSHPKVYVHAPYIGNTGFNNHTRDFLRELSNHLSIKVRNFTVGSSWKNYNLYCHNDEEYINDIDKKILYKQTLWDVDGNLKDFDIYPSSEKEFVPDFHIVLNETNHYYFYENYSKPKIAYTIWESTHQPQDFFNRLLEYDEVWVPSKWQRDVTIKQGFDPNKIKVVPEGVDTTVFFPEKVDLLDEYKDGRFKFILFGRWDYRKSTKEIIETFLKTFKPEEPVDLIVSIDNHVYEKIDGCKTTEERLKQYGLIDPRIKIVHFPSREDYIKFIKTGHVFVSCSRSEGWNLPLIEAMACGTPSIYSQCSGQLEFAKNRGLPVRIKGMTDANKNYNETILNNFPGQIYEPNFDDLSRVMRYAYKNYNSIKKGALKDSEFIRKEFSWKKVAEIGFQRILDFQKKINSVNYKKPQPPNKISITYLDGPKVEITGDNSEEYFVEFIDENDNIVFSSRITNNMWTSCSKKYYKKWKIRINGVVHDTLDLNDKVVLISFESKSIGDTIAWAPYVVEFQKKHNCHVILSTFHNDWFRGHEPYKNITFVEPGSSVNCHALYRIGYFKSESGKWDDYDRCPTQQNTIPLQQAASDILGLEFRELNYGICFHPKERPIKEKYIVFAPQSTAGCKEWVYDNWLTLSQELKKQGFTIITLTSTPYHLPDVQNISGRDWNEVFNYLYHSEFLVGLASGLSWINWALGKKTVMISGFSEESHEFTNNCIRVTNNVCIKCWNDSEMIFDTGDWDWCPVYKGTKKQHVCQKSISVGQVLFKIFSTNLLVY